MGKCELVRLPMHIICDKKGFIRRSVCFFPIGAPVHNANLPAEILKLRFPGIDSVIGNIRLSHSPVIHYLRLLLHMKHRMGLSEGNHLFYKGEQIPVILLKLPVQPGNLIILTVCVIISALTLAKFISRLDQRCTLT